MITYLVKTLLCAFVLYLIYFLLLEREKMHRFNRFYLLFSILFSLTVSLITIKTPSPVLTVNELIAPTPVSGLKATANGFNNQGAVANAVQPKVDATTHLNLPKAQTQVPAEKSIPWFKILTGLYISISAFFFLRFVRNLAALLFKAAHNHKVSYHGATLVLTNDNALPHSFLNYIFIDMGKYEQGTVEREILQHELTHVNQRHSIDILLVELIMIFSWVNPLLFLFRRAIMLNHEYLADESVITTYSNTDSYRLLLFNTISQTNNLVLSSPFNYLTTKKRLIMMTKNTSRKVAMFKQLALIPLIAAIGFFLSARATAQDNLKQPATQKQSLFSKTDAPQSVIDEYKALLDKYKIRVIPYSKERSDSIKKLGPEKLKKIYVKPSGADTIFKVSETDRVRMEQLFFQMSKRQQQKEPVGFKFKPVLSPKLVPTKEQIDLWKKSKIYGIWIGPVKRVKNSELSKYSNTDFYSYSIRQLNEKEAKIMKYQIEVALTTNEQFKSFRAMNLSRITAHPNDLYEMVFQESIQENNLKDTNK